MKKVSTYTDPGKSSFLVTTKQVEHEDSGDISRGWIMDALVSIASELAATSHLHELILSVDEERYQTVAELLNDTVDQRRNKMKRLAGWSKIHCVVKHLLLVWETDMEVWQATGNEEDYKQIELTSQRLAKAISLYLGLDPSDCLRCVSDLLKNTK